MASPRRRSPTYLARKTRRKNERLRRDYLIGRLHIWQEEGRQSHLIPPIRRPLEGAIAIYANHGITQEMYHECHYQYIEERDMGGFEDDEDARVLNFDRIERARNAIKDAGGLPETGLTLPKAKQDGSVSDFTIVVQEKNS